MFKDRMYLRVSCADLLDCASVCELIAERVGKVWDYGFGTAKDPTSGWFETRPREAAREVVLELLRRDLGDRIKEIYPIEAGDGKVHARQMSLIPDRIGGIS